MRIAHGRVSLELHLRAERDGPALLLLHALYGSSAMWGEMPAAWPGRVYALDFCGHGRSDRLRGGGYYPELLAGDADAALAAIGVAALAGAGVGAYVSLLVAAARPDLVPAALLLPGAGLVGGGAMPDLARPEVTLDTPAAGEPAPDGCDPLVRGLDRDVRPVEYAAPLARAARRLLLVEDGQPRPPWWEVCGRSPRAEVVEGAAGVALARLAEALGGSR